MQATKTTAQCCGVFLLGLAIVFPCGAYALTGDYFVASLLIMAANMIPGPVPRALEYDSARCSMTHQRLHYKRRTPPHQDTHNPRLPHPGVRRRTCAARTGASDRRRVSPRNRALCARFRKKRCPSPHPPAFLSGSTGFLFALKRKRVECLQCDQPISVH